MRVLKYKYNILFIFSCIWNVASQSQDNASSLAHLAVGTNGFQKVGKKTEENVQKLIVLCGAYWL